MEQNTNQISPLPWEVQILSRSYAGWMPIAHLATQDLARIEARRYIEARFTARYRRVDEPTIYYP